MMDPFTEEHLAALRDEAQRAYAWAEYVEDHDLPNQDPVAARRVYESAMVALHGALEEEGLELSDNLDAKDWYRPLETDAGGWDSRQEGPERPDDGRGLER